MLIKFSIASSRLMYFMFVEPQNRWQQDHFICSDLPASDKFTAISRLVENRLIGALGIGNIETEKSVAETLLQTVQKGTPKDRNAAWRSVIDLLNKPFLETSLNLKTEYVEFIKTVLEFYQKKKNSSTLATGFSDLSKVLNGLPICDEALALDEVIKSEALEEKKD